MNIGEDTQEGYVEVEGGKIWYRKTGIGRPGIPLLVVHGGPGASCDYLEPLEALSSARPVIFYDQLDCGNSTKTSNPELWTLERFSRELHQIRCALELQQLHILGQSWGCSLAVEYILGKESSGAVSLVLSGPMLSSFRWATDQKKYLADFPPEMQEVIRCCEASGDFSSSAYQNAMMNYYQRHVCRMPIWPDCLNRTFAMLNTELYQYMWGASEFTITGTLKDYDRVKRLSEIRMPVLFTCGAEDEATPETTRFFQQQVQNSQIHIFSDASHEHHLEKLEEYIAVTGDFLAQADQVVR